MSEEFDINSMFDGGGQGAQFFNIGDDLAGTISHMTARQDTDMDTDEPKTWSDGSKVMVPVITLEDTGKTNRYDSTLEKWVENEEEDDGTRVLYARGGLFTAIKNELRKKKVKLEIGGTLSVKLVKKVPPTKKGMSPRKVYEVVYTPPAPKDPFDG